MAIDTVLRAPLRVGAGLRKGVGSKRTDQLESFWGRFVVFLAGFGDFSLLLVNWQVRGG